MKKLPYQFYPIPKVVFENHSLSPNAKLLFTILVFIESYRVNNNNLKSGSFFPCYLRTLANAIGKSTDSVRRDYLPQLISAGLIEKKHLNESEEDNRRTDCLYRIRWESITN